MDPLSHLDQRIAEAKQFATNAGLPMREHTPASIIRIWSRLTAKKEVQDGDSRISGERKPS